MNFRKLQMPFKVIMRHDGNKNAACFMRLEIFLATREFDPANG